MGFRPGNYWEMKKVLFIINTYIDGTGGHYHSLVETESELARFLSTHIVNIGKCASPILRNCKGDYTYIPGDSIRSQREKLLNFILKDQYDVIHAFDFVSLLLVKSLALPEQKIIYTKCGGDFLLDYLPPVSGLVTFHQEDYDYFSRLYGNAVQGRSFVVSNRVTPFSLNLSRINEMVDDYDISDNIFTFMRIGRISNHYEQLLNSSIDLVVKMNDLGCLCQLVIVGNIQSREVYTKLKDKDVSNVIFITEEKYTDNAKELLGVADAVIGTGRSFMEAACMSKPILCYSRSNTYPVLIYKENFASCFKTNFSPRFSCEITDEDNLVSLMRLFSDSKLIVDVGLDNKNYFIQYFSTEALYKSYIKIYDTVAVVTSLWWVRFYAKLMFFAYCRDSKKISMFGVMSFMLKSCSRLYVFSKALVKG